MPTHESAKKRIRQDARRQKRNKGVKTNLTTVTREFREALEDGDVEAAASLMSQVESTYDRAVSKNVIPKKRASRKISRLKKRLHKAKNG